jgi:hypothetical protein
MSLAPKRYRFTIRFKMDSKHENEVLRMGVLGDKQTRLILGELLAQKSRLEQVNDGYYRVRAILDLRDTKTQSSGLWIASETFKGYLPGSGKLVIESIELLPVSTHEGASATPN